MELTAEQSAKFQDLCREIKPGEYGRVVVSFVGEPSNLVQITGEKSIRFHNEKAEPTDGKALHAMAKRNRPL
jgi:serine kinase of HPr protein (carbohydrate metabolism regulator)